MSDRFWVYGLTYPSTGVFYVGFTCNPWQRFAAHWAANGDCSSYRIIRLWKRSGQKFDHLIFGDFDNSLDARRLERLLMLSLPGLVNSLSPQAMISTYWYDADEGVDQFMLREAYARVGWEIDDAIAEIDRSGEYVDERYDDLDFIDGP